MNPVLKILLIVAALLLLAAIACGIHWWVHGSYCQSTNDAYLQADQVGVASRISGYVEEVLVRVAARDDLARAAKDRGQIAEAEAAHSRAQEAQYAASARYDAFEARRYRPLAASGAETREKLAHYVSQAQQSAAEWQAARADTGQPRANYRKMVLSALPDAGNVLSRFGHQRDDVVVLAEAESSAKANRTSV